MLDMIEFVLTIIDILAHPSVLLGAIFAFLALACFEKFIYGCQIGNWFLIIGGFILSALFGFLTYKLWFDRN